MDCTCGHQNRPGTLFCEECGNSLSGNGRAGSTKTVTTPLGDDANRLNLGSALATPAISLHFEDGRTLPLAVTGSVIVGRADDDSQTYPDIDLNPYGALPRGVSRKHALIDRKENALTITDLRSSNGTFLNGQRLQPGDSRVLRDGDEIHFGKLVATVAFDTGATKPILNREELFQTPEFQQIGSHA